MRIKAEKISIFITLLPICIICSCYLTHWGRVTHICVSKLTIIGSDNVLSPGRRQAIIWTNAGILLIRTLGTEFSEILGIIHAFSFKKMHLKMSSAIEVYLVSTSIDNHSCQVLSSYFLQILLIETTQCGLCVKTTSCWRLSTRLQ